MLSDTSSSYQPTSLDELHSPYDIGVVCHFAHSLKMLLKGIKNSKELNKNIQTLLKILCTLPVTLSAHTEMSKNVSQVHHAMMVDNSRVVDTFARKNSRRMALTNILQTSLKFTIT